MARSLPPRPTLEHLKKEARALFKAHKAGDAKACDTLRLLRRFAKANDEEILKAELALSEAQFALAVDYGFASWDKLKSHVQSARPAAPGRRREYAQLDLRCHCMRKDTFSMSLAGSAGGQTWSEPIPISATSRPASPGR